MRKILAITICVGCFFILCLAVAEKIDAPIEITALDSIDNSYEQSAGHEDKYRIKWVSPKTGVTGMGETLFDKRRAQRICKQLNRDYDGDILHTPFAAGTLHGIEEAATAPDIDLNGATEPLDIEVKEKCPNR